MRNQPALHPSSQWINTENFQILGDTQPVINPHPSPWGKGIDKIKRILKLKWSITLLTWFYVVWINEIQRCRISAVFTEHGSAANISNKGGCLINRDIPWYSRFHFRSSSHIQDDMEAISPELFSHVQGSVSHHFCICI